eukprot:g27155.t1
MSGSSVSDDVCVPEEEGSDAKNDLTQLSTSSTSSLPMSQTSSNAQSCSQTVRSKTFEGLARYLGLSNFSFSSPEQSECTSPTTSASSTKMVRIPTPSADSIFSHNTKTRGSGLGLENVGYDDMEAGDKYDNYTTETFSPDEETRLGTTSSRTLEGVTFSTTIPGEGFLLGKLAANDTIITREFSISNNVSFPRRVTLRTDLPSRLSFRLVSTNSGNMETSDESPPPIQPPHSTTCEFDLSIGGSQTVEVCLNPKALAATSSDEESVSLEPQDATSSSSGTDVKKNQFKFHKITAEIVISSCSIAPTPATIDSEESSSPSFPNITECKADILTLPLVCYLCRSFVSVPLADQELNFDPCAPNASSSRTFAIWNSSEIETRVALRLRARNPECWEFSDYDTGRSMAAEWNTIAGFGHRTVRVKFRPKAGDGHMGDFNPELVIMNNLDKSNQIPLHLTATVINAEEVQGLEISPVEHEEAEVLAATLSRGESWLEHRGRFVSEHNVLDFGDCYSGNAKAALFQIRNLTSHAIEVRLRTSLHSDSRDYGKFSSGGVEDTVTFDLHNPSSSKQADVDYGDELATVGSGEHVRASSLDTHKSEHVMLATDNPTPIRHRSDVQLVEGVDSVEGATKEPRTGSVVERAPSDLDKDKDRNRDRIEEVLLQPGQVRHVVVQYRPGEQLHHPSIPEEEGDGLREKEGWDDLPFEMDGVLPSGQDQATSSIVTATDVRTSKIFRFSKRRFRIILQCFDPSAQNQRALKQYDRRIKAKARVCTSWITLKPEKINFGDCNIGTRKEATVQLFNQSELPAFVRMVCDSKSVSMSVSRVTIPPRQSYDLSIVYVPRKVNPEYTRDITITNVHTPENELTIVIRATNIDEHGVLLHSLFYKITTASSSAPNSIDFRNVVINAPCVRSFTVSNVTDFSLTVRITASTPEIQIYHVNPDAKDFDLSTFMSHVNAAETTKVGMAQAFADEDAEASYIKKLIQARREVEASLKEGKLEPLRMLRLANKESRQVVVIWTVAPGKRPDIQQGRLRNVEEVVLIQLIKHPQASPLMGGQTNAGKISVRELEVHAKVCRSIMEISQRNIHFGTVSQGERKETSLILANPAAVPLVYSITKTGSIASGDLILPKKPVGIIPPYGRKEVPLVFRPSLSLSGKFVERITVENVQAGEVEVLTVKANILKPLKFALRETALDMGVTMVDELSTPRVLTVHNTTDKTRSFKVKHIPSDFKLLAPDVEVLGSELSSEVSDGMRQRVRIVPELVFTLDTATPVGLDDKVRQETQAELLALQQKLKIAIRKQKTEKIEDLKELINQKKAILGQKPDNDEEQKQADTDAGGGSLSGASPETVQKQEHVHSVVFLVEPNMEQRIMVQFRGVLQQRTHSQPLHNQQPVSGTLTIYESSNKEFTKTLPYRALICFDKGSFEDAKAGRRPSLSVVPSSRTSSTGISRDGLLSRDHSTDTAVGWTRPPSIPAFLGIGSADSGESDEANASNSLDWFRKVAKMGDRIRIGLTKAIRPDRRIGRDSDDNEPGGSLFNIITEPLPRALSELVKYSPPSVPFMDDLILSLPALEDDTATRCPASHMFLIARLFVAMDLEVYWFPPEAPAAARTRVLQSLDSREKSLKESFVATSDDSADDSDGGSSHKYSASEISPTVKQLLAALVSGKENEIEDALAPALPVRLHDPESLTDADGFSALSNDEEGKRRVDKIRLRYGHVADEFELGLILPQPRMNSPIKARQSRKTFRQRRSSELKHSPQRHMSGVSSSTDNTRQKTTRRSTVTPQKSQRAMSYDRSKLLSTTISEHPISSHASSSSQSSRNASSSTSHAAGAGGSSPADSVFDLSTFSSTLSDPHSSDSDTRSSPGKIGSSVWKLSEIEQTRLKEQTIDQHLGSRFLGPSAHEVLTSPSWFGSGRQTRQSSGDSGTCRVQLSPHDQGMALLSLRVLDADRYSFVDQPGQQASGGVLVFSSRESERRRFCTRLVRVRLLRRDQPQSPLRLLPELLELGTLPVGKVATGQFLVSNAHKQESAFPQHQAHATASRGSVLLENARPRSLADHWNRWRSLVARARVKLADKDAGRLRFRVSHLVSATSTHVRQQFDFFNTEGDLRAEESTEVKFSCLVKAGPPGDTGTGKQVHSILVEDLTNSCRRILTVTLTPKQSCYLSFPDLGEDHVLDLRYCYSVNRDTASPRVDVGNIFAKVVRFRVQNLSTIPLRLAVSTNLPGQLFVFADAELKHCLTIPPKQDARVDQADTRQEPIMHFHLPARPERDATTAEEVSARSERDTTTAGEDALTSVLFIAVRPRNISLGSVDNTGEEYGRPLVAGLHFNAFKYDEQTPTEAAEEVQEVLAYRSVRVKAITGRSIMSVAAKTESSSVEVKTEETQQQKNSPIMENSTQQMPRFFTERGKLPTQLPSIVQPVCRLAQFWMPSQLIDFGSCSMHPATEYLHPATEAPRRFRLRGRVIISNRTRGLPLFFQLEPNPNSPHRVEVTPKEGELEGAGAVGGGDIAECHVELDPADVGLLHETIIIRNCSAVRNSGRKCDSSSCFTGPTAVVNLRAFVEDGRLALLPDQKERSSCSAALPSVKRVPVKGTKAQSSTTRSHQSRRRKRNLLSTRQGRGLSSSDSMEVRPYEELELGELFLTPVEQVFPTAQSFGPVKPQLTRIDTSSLSPDSTSELPSQTSLNGVENISVTANKQLCRPSIFRTASPPRKRLERSTRDVQSPISLPSPRMDPNASPQAVSPFMTAFGGSRNPVRSLQEKSRESLDSNARSISKHVNLYNPSLARDLNPWQMGAAGAKALQMFEAREEARRQRNLRHLRWEQARQIERKALGDPNTATPLAALPSSTHQVHMVQQLLYVSLNMVKPLRAHFRLQNTTAATLRINPEAEVPGLVALFSVHSIPPPLFLFHEAATGVAADFPSASHTSDTSGSSEQTLPRGRGSFQVCGPTHVLNPQDSVFVHVLFQYCDTIEMNLLSFLESGGGVPFGALLAIRSQLLSSPKERKEQGGTVVKKETSLSSGSSSTNHIKKERTRSKSKKKKSKSTEKGARSSSASATSERRERSKSTSSDVSNQTRKVKQPKEGNKRLTGTSSLSFPHPPSSRPSSISICDNSLESRISHVVRLRGTFVVSRLALEQDEAFLGRVGYDNQWKAVKFTLNLRNISCCETAFRIVEESLPAHITYRGHLFSPAPTRSPLGISTAAESGQDSNLGSRDDLGFLNLRHSSKPPAENPFLQPVTSSGSNGGMVRPSSPTSVTKRALSGEDQPPASPASPSDNGNQSQHTQAPKEQQLWQQTKRNRIGNDVAGVLRAGEERELSFLFHCARLPLGPFRYGLAISNDMNEEGGVTFYVTGEVADCRLSFQRLHIMDHVVALPTVSPLVSQENDMDIDASILTRSLKSMSPTSLPVASCEAPASIIYTPRSASEFPNRASTLERELKLPCMLVPAPAEEAPCEEWFSVQNSFTETGSGLSASFGRFGDGEAWDARSMRLQVEVELLPEVAGFAMVQIFSRTSNSPLENLELRPGERVELRVRVKPLLGARVPDSLHQQSICLGWLLLRGDPDVLPKPEKIYLTGKFAQGLAFALSRDRIRFQDSGVFSGGRARRQSSEFLEETFWVKNQSSTNHLSFDTLITLPKRVGAEIGAAIDSLADALLVNPKSTTVPPNGSQEVQVRVKRGHEALLALHKKQLLIEEQETLAASDVSKLASGGASEPLVLQLVIMEKTYSSKGDEVMLDSREHLSRTLSVSIPPNLMFSPDDFDPHQDDEDPETEIAGETAEDIAGEGLPTRASSQEVAPPVPPLIQSLSQSDVLKPSATWNTARKLGFDLVEHRQRHADSKSRESPADIALAGSNFNSTDLSERKAPVSTDVVANSLDGNQDGKKSNQSPQFFKGESKSALSSSSSGLTSVPVPTLEVRGCRRVGRSGRYIIHLGHVAQSLGSKSRTGATPEWELTVENISSCPVQWRLAILNTGAYSLSGYDSFASKGRSRGGKSDELKLHSEKDHSKEKDKYEEEEDDDNFLSPGMGWLQLSTRSGTLHQLHDAQSITLRCSTRQCGTHSLHLMLFTLGNPGDLKIIRVDVHVQPPSQLINLGNTDDVQATQRSPTAEHFFSLHLEGRGRKEASARDASAEGVPAVPVIDYGDIYYGSTTAVRSFVIENISEMTLDFLLSAKLDMQDDKATSRSARPCAGLEFHFSLSQESIKLLSNLTLQPRGRVRVYLHLRIWMPQETIDITEVEEESVERAHLHRVEVSLDCRQLRGIRGASQRINVTARGLQPQMHVTPSDLLFVARVTHSLTEPALLLQRQTTEVQTKPTNTASSAAILPSQSEPASVSHDFSVSLSKKDKDQDVVFSSPRIFEMLPESTGDSGDERGRRVRVTNMKPFKPLVFAVRNTTRFFVVSGIAMAPRGHFGLAGIDSSSSSLSTHPSSTISAGTSSSTISTPRSSPPSLDSRALCDSATSFAAGAEKVCSAPYQDLFIRPNLSALQAAQPHLYRYVEERVIIYNRNQLREKCVLTLRFCTGFTAPLWYVAPSFDRGVFSRMEETISRLIMDVHVLFDKLVVSLKPRLPVRDQQVDIDRQSAVAAPAAIKAVPSDSNHVDNEQTSASSEPASPIKRERSTDVQGNLARAAEVDAMLEQWTKTCVRYSELYFDFHFLTDQLVAAGMKRYVAHQVFQLANLLYLCILQHDIFSLLFVRTYASRSSPVSPQASTSPGDTSVSTSYPVAPPVYANSRDLSVPTSPFPSLSISATTAFVPIDSPSSSTAAALSRSESIASSTSSHSSNSSSSFSMEWRAAVVAYPAPPGPPLVEWINQLHYFLSHFTRRPKADALSKLRTLADRLAKGERSVTRRRQHSRIIN